MEIFRWIFYSILTDNLNWPVENVMKLFDSCLLLKYQFFCCAFYMMTFLLLWAGNDKSNLSKFKQKTIILIKIPFLENRIAEIHIQSTFVLAIVFSCRKGNIYRICWNFRQQQNEHIREPKPIENSVNQKQSAIRKWFELVQKVSDLLPYILFSFSEYFRALSEQAINIIADFAQIPSSQTTV